MVPQFDGFPARACSIVTLLMASLAGGHALPASDEDRLKTVAEVHSEAVAFAGTDSETAWMVTAIIFIVLFALAIIVCIYLWHLRNAKTKELRHLENIRAGVGKDNQNVWYGGGAHM